MIYLNQRTMLDNCYEHFENARLCLLSSKTVSQIKLFTTSSLPFVAFVNVHHKWISYILRLTEGYPAHLSPDFKGQITKILFKICSRMNHACWSWVSNSTVLTPMLAVYKEYSCNVGSWTSKYLELVEPCKQHLALWSNVQTMYIFLTSLSYTFNFCLKSKNLK